MFLCLLPAGAFRSQICEVEFGHILEKSSQEKLSTYFSTGSCNVVEQRLILDVDVIHYIKKGGGGGGGGGMLDEVIRLSLVYSHTHLTWFASPALRRVEGQKSGHQQFL